jgi:hypothetical protein
MRIAFLGDINLETDLATWEAADVPDFHEALGVDLVVGNFESTIDGEKFEPRGRTDKMVQISVDPRVIDKLRRCGVDVVSVANNHVTDFEAEAARHTIETLQAAFGEDRVFGWVAQPSIELVPGLRVVGIVYPETMPRRVEGEWDAFVGEEDEGVVPRFVRPDEKLVVYAHWGWEVVMATSPVVRRRARTLVREGAAQVIGLHTHVTGGGEDIGEATVLYSLGNLLFRVFPSYNDRMIDRLRRSTVAVYDWDGTNIRLVETWTGHFDERFNLTLTKNRRRLPGGPAVRLQHAVPDALAAVIYAYSRHTRWFRVSVATVVEGVEGPFGERTKRLVTRTGRRLLGRRPIRDAAEPSD